jgi:hypothetical protein
MTAYVIPPVNAEAINTSDAQLGITDAMLLYSSVPEAPPEAWDEEVIYGVDEQVSGDTVDGAIHVWRSKQAGNTGNPLEEGLWWAFAGTTYPLWDPEEDYTQGDLVIRTNVHQVFRRATEEEPEKDLKAVNWSLVGTTNRWAMFDMLSDEATQAPGPVVVRLKPGRISGVALIGASDGTAKFAMEAYGETVWDPDPFTLDTTVIGSWEDYFFAPFDARSNVVRLDAPTYEGGELTITISAGLQFALQFLVVGTAQVLGSTEIGPRVRDRSLSVADRDKFGRLKSVSKRKSISNVTQTMFAEKAIIVRAREAMREARSCPSVFVGLDNNEDEYADLLTLLGICIDSEIDLREHEYSSINLEIESV